MNKDGEIIVIEDDPDDQELLINVFETLAISNKIVFFPDGEEVLEYLLQPEVVPFLMKSATTAYARSAQGYFRKPHNVSFKALSFDVDWLNEQNTRNRKENVIRSSFMCSMLIVKHMRD